MFGYRLSEIGAAFGGAVLLAIFIHGGIDMLLGRSADHGAPPTEMAASESMTSETAEPEEKPEAAETPDEPLTDETIAAADADSGAKIFKRKCKACHTEEEGAKNRVGPNLWGVKTRAAGQVADFKYSDAMLGSGVTWDVASLDKYLADPKGFIPKNKMAFKGLPKGSDRADIIAFLSGLK